MKKYDKLILVALLVVFGAGIYFTAQSAFTSYVTFAQAKESYRSAQVKGTPMGGTLRELDDDRFSFEMKDMEGSVYRVVAKGMIPVNLFEADYVVVKGRFEGEEFVSKNVLVKCPSKYEAEQPPASQ